MACFYGLGYSVVDYVISDTHALNCITSFDILSFYWFDSDQKPLYLTLNLSIHLRKMQEACEIQRHTHFDQSYTDLFLKDIKRELSPLTYNNNIDQIYYNSNTTLSTTIKKFSTGVSYNKINITSNPWYDKECQISKKVIREAPNEPLKLWNISIYKTLIKKKKRSYINKRQEHLLRLSKVAPTKFWQNVLVHKSESNHSMSLVNWDIYLKNLYDSSDTMYTIVNNHIKEDVFSLEDIESWINKLANGKPKDIDVHQDEIFKIGRSILIPHLQKLLNLAIKLGFPKTLMQSLIVPIFENGDKNTLSNYMTIMISHILAKLYGHILETKISL